MSLAARRAASAQKRPDHRRAPRREVAVHGLLIHGRALQSAPCTIRDVSAIGARVKLKSPDFISRPLHLVIGKTGAAFEAEIAWAKDNELGLEFKGRVNLVEPASDLEKAMSRIWKAAAR